MAKDKDRALNPAAAQRKLEKQKALKKGKATILAQRTSRLATRNPARLERQIADQRAQEQETGKPLGGREKRILEDAERDLARVKKARESVAATGGGGGGGGGGGREKRGVGMDGGRGNREGGGGEGKAIGKRNRGFGNTQEREDQEEIEDTDESVRRIPMPNDTPPPIPTQRHISSAPPPSSPFPPGFTTTNPNLQPLGTHRDVHSRPGPPTTTTNPSPPPTTTKTTTTPPTIHPHPLPAPPPPPSSASHQKKIYVSAPAVRDLRQEAVDRFVPAAVRRKLDLSRGLGGGGGGGGGDGGEGGVVGRRLPEEEEVARLEREGYLVGGGGGGEGGEKGREEEDEKRRLREEERFERELEMEGVMSGREVRVEEVSDEDL